jgi:transketolase
VKTNLDCSSQRVAELKELSKKVRLQGLDMTMTTGTRGAHLGGSFSCVEILTVLYLEVMDLNPSDPFNPDRDRFYPSKNHCTLSHLPVLALKGFIKESELLEFQKDGGRLTGYPKRVECGLEYSGGSLGQAISVGIGTALAMRKKGIDKKVFVLMGDGELNEGSIWEAFMSANQYKLDNLVVIIDRNHLSYDGDTEDVMGIDSISEKLKAFHWNPIECNGHDIASLLKAFSSVKTGVPNIIIADTVKGKGVSFIENQREWHHHALTEEQYEQAKAEIMNT